MNSVNPTRHDAAFKALQAQTRHHHGQATTHDVHHALAGLDGASSTELLAYMGSWLTYALYTHGADPHPLGQTQAHLEIFNLDTGATETIPEVPEEEVLPIRMVVALINADVDTARILWDMADQHRIRPLVVRTVLNTAAQMVNTDHPHGGLICG